MRCCRTTKRPAGDGFTRVRLLAGPLTAATAPITAVVSGATVTAIPKPSTTIEGKNVTQ